VARTSLPYLSPRRTGWSPFLPSAEAQRRPFTLCALSTSLLLASLALSSSLAVCPPAPALDLPPSFSLRLDLRECDSSLCSGGAPGVTSWVRRSTWFEHRRLRSGRPHRPRTAEVAAAEASGAAAAAAAPLAADAPASGRGGVGDGEGGAGGEAETVAGSGEAESGPAPNPEPPTLRPNGVCIPVKVVKDNIDDFVAYNFVVQHCLSREATEDYLRQRRSAGTCHTPYALNAIVHLSVDLYTKKVDCCSGGCVAFTAERKALTACDSCKAPRYRADGKPHKQDTYWPLLPRLRMMLADAKSWAGMVTAVKEAREAAASSPAEGVRDWYDGATFGKLEEIRYFSSITCVALSISTDGFQAWKQRGFEGWPIIATINDVDPSARVQVVSQLILGITTGRSQPADFESFLNSIAEALDVLAAGVSGVNVTGFPKSQGVRAFDVRFTTDMTAGDKLPKAIGGNGEYPGRFRLFCGVWLNRRYYYPPYAPDDLPPSKRRRFDVGGNTTPRRKAASIPAEAARVENARRKVKSNAAVSALAHKEGIKGYSLFFAPSPEDKARYPSLKYLREIGPDLLPYDTMHLFLCNVVPRMWELFAGENEKLGVNNPWVIPIAARETIGREIEAGRSTVPRSQARSLRNIQKHSGPYKAVDWLNFLPSVGEVLLADRISEEFFKIFMLIFQAGHLLFRPSSWSEEDSLAADNLLRHFFQAFYRHVYAGKVERLRVCRPPVVALREVPANIRACGPAWPYWQFPAERLIGTLTRLIRSRRFPYAALTTAVSKKYSAELVISFEETHAAGAWAEATGKPIQGDIRDPAGTFSVPKEPDVDLLHHRRAAAALIGRDLACMKTVLVLEHSHQCRANGLKR